MLPLELPENWLPLTLLTATRVGGVSPLLGDRLPQEIGSLQTLQSGQKGSFPKLGRDRQWLLAIGWHFEKVPASHVAKSAFSFPDLVNHWDCLRLRCVHGEVTNTLHLFPFYFRFRILHRLD